MLAPRQAYLADRTHIGRFQASASPIGKEGGAVNIIECVLRMLEVAM